jgi:predicted nuclease of predicted toxin-antitoxin system
MKFIVDQQLPPTLVRWLIERGHEAEHVRDIGMREAADHEIWLRAVAQDSIVITKDEDFAQRRGQSSSGPQIVWLRVGNTTRQALFERLDAGWFELNAALVAGASIVEVH